MQTTPKNNRRSKPAPPKGRQVADRRKDRKGQDGSIKTGTSQSFEPVFRLHLLTKGLRSIPMFETVMRFGDKRDLLQTINTEAKQLQAISDLYDIVKAQPKYKNLKEPNWAVDTEPVIVLGWLLRKLGPLAKGSNWTIDNWQDGKKQRFRFVIFKHFNRNYLKEREEHFPLDFLPRLLKRDQPLHDIIVDCVALVSRVNKIPLWDMDGDFSEGVKELVGRDVSANNALREQKECYTIGEAAQYIRLIHKRQRRVSVDSLEDLIDRYNGTSERKRVMIWWVRMGLKLAQSGKNLLNNSFVPNFHNGQAYGADRLYKFVWSVQQNNFVTKRAYQIIRRSEKVGLYLPVMYSSCLPWKRLAPIKEENFPEKLYHFMREGVASVLWRYRDYFYGRSKKPMDTPAEDLLNIIEEDEIRIEL